MPSSFVRGHGLHVNKQSKPRKKRLSNIPAVRDLEEEYPDDLPLPSGFHLKRLRMGREIQYRDEASALPRRFIRLTISRETVNIKPEVFLNQTEPISRQSRLFGNEVLPSANMPEGLVVLDLLRNESHADVYLVQDLNNPSKSYHAHALMSDGLSGNWPTFLRRKMDRLRRSNDFHAETVQLGRKIIFMKADSKADEGFQIKSMGQQFPPLPATDLKPPTPPTRKNRLSYAAVVTGKRPPKRSTKSNYRAYKAWEGRNLGRRRKPGTQLSQPGKKLEEPAPMTDPMVHRKKI